MVRRNTRRVCGRQVCNDSNRGFFATRARLGRSPNNNSTSSRAGEDLPSLFDRRLVSLVCLPSDFPLFFSISPSFRLLSFEMEELFFLVMEKLVMDLSMDEFLLKSGDFVARKVIVHPPLSISRVSQSGEMIFWRDEVFFLKQLIQITKDPSISPTTRTRIKRSNNW